MNTYSRFTGQRFDSAANNNPPMKKGETGEPVRVLQQALIDLGHPLPVSTKKYGSPDGIYGDETVEAVKSFQRKNGLSSEADGRVGRNTLAKLRAKPIPPKTLPPLPTGPTAPTQVDQLRQLIVKTLDEVDIVKVFHVMGADEINWGWFRKVRNLVEADKIHVNILPSLPGDATYNFMTDAFEFQASSVNFFLTAHVNVRALIVHEAVHATMDIRGKMVRHSHAEACSYVAQCMYMKAKGQLLQTADKSDPNLTDALIAANALADKYIASQDYRATKAELDNLYLLLENSKLYASAPVTVSYNGVPE